MHYEQFMRVLRDVVNRGNSAQRQRKVFSSTNDVGAVISHNVQELRSGHPNWSGPGL
jgi:gamma-glutamyl:cysteine ligase YbdK (ATP-grasp superfamily)